MLHYKRVSLIRRDVEGGHDVEVQIQTACVFLGQTSGEHKKKKRKNLQSFGAAAVSASLSSYKSLCHPVFLCIVWSHCKYCNGCANKKNKKNNNSSFSLTFSSEKVTSVKRRQQKLEFAFAALAHTQQTLSLKLIRRLYQQQCCKHR